MIFNTALPELLTQSLPYLGLLAQNGRVFVGPKGIRRSAEYIFAGIGLLKNAFFLIESVAISSSHTFISRGLLREQDGHR